jgi:hypothetical protein
MVKKYHTEEERLEAQRQAIATLKRNSLLNNKEQLQKLKHKE